MNRNFPFLIVLSSLLWGCKSTDVSDSTNVAQSEIHPALYATFDEIANQTSLEAVFRFGGATGTTLRLAGGSKVSVNDSVMDGFDMIFQGFIYTKKQKGMVSQARFTFLDTEGKSYTNTLRVEGYSQLNVPPEIQIGKETTISWMGPLPRGGEDVRLEIHPDSGRTIIINPAQSDPYSFVISAEKLENVVPGKASVSFSRSMKARLSEATHLGGSYVAEFKGRRYPTEIK